ncbi:hypothetical protein DOTSEDRAFT_102791 [Lecanosticta acicola]|uniref:Rhodopsin domain-containing protein n=1 Tax=Lecanosticta acicola TaxID=111012 RepID=A0AAI8Z0M5_9PEZI|nr:hypothetical protein DOTSEDRAFT_102791 [Lecanosticta acicola]
MSRNAVPDLLASKKVQAEMCGLPIRNRISALVVTQSILFALTIAFVAARVVSRGQWNGGAGYGWDDWVLFATCFPMLGLTVTGYLEQHAGLGQDVWELSVEEIKKVVMLFYIGNTFYAPVVIGTKIAFVLLYIRVWEDVHTVFPRICKGVVLLLVMALLGFEFSTIFLCVPVDYTWRSLTEHIEGHCINRDAQLYTNSSINIAFDFVVLLLPVSNVVGLRMGRTKKIGILSTFSVGFAVTATSVVQLYYLIKYVSRTENPTWDLFPIAVTRVVEVYLSIICCCMPMMAGLGKRFFRRLGDTISMHSSLSDSKWKNFGSSKGSKNGTKGASVHDADSVLQLTARPSAGGGNEEGDLRRGWQNENGSELEERETSASRSNSDETEDNPSDNKRHTRSGDEQRKAAESMLYGSARSEAQPFGENISPDQAQFFEDVTPMETTKNEGREGDQQAPERHPRRSREDDHTKHKRTDTSSKAYTALPFVFGDGPALQLDDPSQKARGQHHLLTAPGSAGRVEDKGPAQKRNGPPPRQQDRHEDRHHILTPRDKEYDEGDVAEDEQARRLASSVNTLRPPGHDKGRSQGDALPLPYSPSIYDSWDTTPASDLEGVSLPSASQEDSTDDEEVAIPNDVKTLPSQGGRNLYDTYQRGIAADGGKTTDTPLAELGYGGTPYNKKTGYFSQKDGVVNPKGWVSEPSKYAAGIKRLSAYDSPAYYGGPDSPASAPPSPPLSPGGTGTRKMWHPDGSSGQDRVTPPGSPRNLKPYELGQIKLTSTPPPQAPDSANAAEEEQRLGVTQGAPPPPAKAEGRKRASSIASTDYPAHQYVRGSDGSWDLARDPGQKSHSGAKDGRNDGERDDAPVRPKAPTPAIPTAAEYMARLLRSDSDHVPQWSPDNSFSPDRDAPGRRPAPGPLQFLEFSESRFDEANQRHPEREPASLWQGGRTSGFEDHVQRRRVADAERQMEREQPVFPVTPPPDLSEEKQRKLDVALGSIAPGRGVYDNRDWDRADDWDNNDPERYQQGDWPSNDRGWQEYDDDFYRGRRWDGPAPQSNEDDYWGRRFSNQSYNGQRSRSVEISPEDHWHRGSIDHHRTSGVSPEDYWGHENGNRWMNRSVTTPAEDSFWHRRNVGGYGTPAETPMENRWRRRSSERYNYRRASTPVDDRWRRRSTERYDSHRASTPVGDRWPPPAGERYRRRSVETPLADQWQRFQNRRLSGGSWQEQSNRRFSSGSWQEQSNRRYQPETPQFYRNPETPLSERFNWRNQPETPLWRGQETPQYERFHGRYQPETPLWKSQETPQFERFNGRYEAGTPQWKSQETPQFERSNGRYEPDTPQYRNNNDEDEDDGYEPWRPSAALQKSLDEYTRKSMADWNMTADSFKPRRAKTTAVPTVNDVYNDQEDYPPSNSRRSLSHHDGERSWKHDEFFVPPATQAEADKSSQGYVPRVLRSEKAPVSGWAALDQRGWSDNRDDEEGEQKKRGSTGTEEKSNAWAPVEVPR